MSQQCSTDVLYFNCTKKFEKTYVTWLIDWLILKTDCTNLFFIYLFHWKNKKWEYSLDLMLHMSPPRRTHSGKSSLRIFTFLRFILLLRRHHHHLFAWIVFNQRLRMHATNDFLTFLVWLILFYFDSGFCQLTFF